MATKETGVERFYRDQFLTQGCHAFRVHIEESDLFFVCDAPGLEPLARRSVASSRRHLEEAIARRREFATSLSPLAVEPGAAPIVSDMAAAADLYGVGPMAAVAGAVAQYAGETLAPHCQHLVVENGGDIWVRTGRPLTIGVYAGDKSPFTGRLRFRVDPQGRPLGICTSSGTVGHSLSFGHSDAVVTIAERADVADAAATAIGNRIVTPADIEPVMAEEQERGLLLGLIVVIQDRMGAWGNLELV